MANDSEFQPDWASHPGETLLELVEFRGLKEADLADLLGMKVEDAEDLLAGRMAISDSIATTLAYHFGTSREFWISREKQYRASKKCSQRLVEKKLTGRDWLQQLPLSDMVKFGWIPRQKGTESKLDACLKFFDVTTIEDWSTKHRASLAVAAFRTTSSFNTNGVSVSAWLRVGEIRATAIECANWNKEQLEKIIPHIKRLTWNKDPKLFMPKLEALCASCGVAVVVARAPKGCRASGATRFLTDSKALILLSFRHLSDDHFWFTFFHEISHLILHGKDALFLEDDSEVSDDEEHEANQFAQNALIPPMYRSILMTMPLDKVSIINFSKMVGVAPGIVVGQLQFMKRIPHDKLNYFKRRYKWDDHNHTITASASEVFVD